MAVFWCLSGSFLGLLKNISFTPLDLGKHINTVRLIARKFNDFNYFVFLDRVEGGVNTGKTPVNTSSGPNPEQTAVCFSDGCVRVLIRC
jgi:hypothetical protein